MPTLSSLEKTKWYQQKQGRAVVILIIVIAGK